MTNNSNKDRSQDRELYCDECPDIEFDSEDELREHMIEVHNFKFPQHGK
jgi:hypothetical protein